MAARATKTATAPETSDTPTPKRTRAEAKRDREVKALTEQIVALLNEDPKRTLDELVEATNAAPERVKEALRKARTKRTVHWGQEIEEIMARREAGETLDAIASTYGVSRQRMYQVLAAHADAPRTGLKAREARHRTRAQEIDALSDEIVAILNDDAVATIDDLAERTGARRDYVVEALRKAKNEKRALQVVPHGERRRTTDKEMLLILKQAAADMPDNRISVVRFREWRATSNPDAVNPTVYIQRFGSWAAACELAGVKDGGRRRDEYIGLGHDDFVLWVAHYIKDEPETPTFSGYHEWAQETPGAPSGALMRLDSPWSTILQEAWALVRKTKRLPKPSPVRSGRISA